MAQFEHAFVVRAPLAQVWAFHADPFSLPKVMRGPMRVRVVHVDQPMRAGSRIIVELQLGPLRRAWHLRVRAFDPPHAFADEQIPGEGPFRHWEHLHRFEAIDDAHTRVVDRLVFALPGGLLGGAVGWIMARVMLPVVFAARAAATRSLLEQHP